MVNTPYEVKNVPGFTDAKPDKEPTQTSFVKEAIHTAAIFYMVIDVLTVPGPPPNADVIFASHRIPVLSRLSEIEVEETGLRLATTIALWLTEYCVLRMYYAILAVLTVRFGWYQVHDWRPPFGDMVEAWSIRQFWGSVNRAACLFNAL